MPEVFSLGPFLIPTVRLSLLLSLLLAIWLAARFAKSRQLDSEWIGNVAEISVWLGLIGARLGFVLANWSAYRNAPWTALYVWQPGYLPVAGLLFGGAYAFWRLRQRELTERGRYLQTLGSGFAVAALIFGAIYFSTTISFDNSLLRKGDTVPDFTLQNLDGEKVSFSDLEGRAVVLNFWATWCPPCRREMPLLDNIQKEYDPRGLTIVGIDLDEPLTAVKPFIEDMGVTYPIWVDAPGNSPGFDRSRDIYAQFGGVGLPTTIFVDAEGVIKSTQVGELSRAILENNIKAILPR